MISTRMMLVVLLLLAAPLVSAETPGHSGAGGVTFDGKTYTNRLIHSHDPYLLMHAHNPVDWYPWGPEALAAAKREHKPIFLSVGYSTCYWCHVAEREIYSNPKIAKLMNAWFINIKVDREQRPDVDRVYMLATELLTGTGGWPNNVFLTPDLKPFYAGSYFPPQDRDGRPGFPHILAVLHETWVKQPATLNAIGAHIYRAMQQAEKAAASAGTARPHVRAWRAKALRQAAARFDELEGGFADGGSTRFPNSPLLSLLLVSVEHQPGGSGKTRAMLVETLRAMAEGGVFDQIGGGFHRYSIDPGWNIPHFEKMLYDNAQLLGLYARTYALTGQLLFKRVAVETARWLEAEMQAPGGGFYSAQDAETDGVEGASYVWTREQIAAVLGKAKAKRFFGLYEITSMPASHAGQRQPLGGVLRLNRNVADRLAAKAQLAARIGALRPLREQLLAARRARPQPATDKKIVTATNALAILGFLEAGQALHNEPMRRTAITTANWEWQHAFNAHTGLLYHQIFQRQASGDGFLDDYALLGRSFLALYQVTHDVVWHERAKRLADLMLQRFQRPDGSLATTTDTADLLLAPPLEGDSAQPSGPSAAVALLLGLAAHGDARYGIAARRVLASLSRQVSAEPSNWGALLAALTRHSLVEALNRVGKKNAVAGQVPGKSRSATRESADHLHARAQWAPDGHTLRITVMLDQGFHINANPASEKGLIPTTVTLPGVPHAKVYYPPGELFRAPFALRGIRVYTGTIELRVSLPLHARLPGHARLRVQACSDRSCLIPSTIELALPKRASGSE